MKSHSTLFRVSKNQRDGLLALPETGMGYQIAGQDLIVNATVILPMPWPGDRRGRVSSEGAEALDGMVELLLTGEDPDCFTDLPERDVDLDELETHGSYGSRTRPGELFVRYSAFRNDRRIGADGSVSKGTYVTTAADAATVPSGLAAVGRYALPNPAPAIWSFTLAPAVGTAIRCGTVAPSFGQAGGGVEVLFANPLPNGAAQGPVPIVER
jgi:hypothetical protein